VEVGSTPMASRLGAQNLLLSLWAYAPHTTLIRRGESDPFVRLGLGRGLFLFLSSIWPQNLGNGT
jgi:hypothetical protein